MSFISVEKVLNERELKMEEEDLKTDYMKTIQEDIAVEDMLIRTEGVDFGNPVT